ncbi:OB-fold nucleic acid binding domain-containing protein [Kitasatospora sp. RB6PN24]|uniref:OB-fold nucleic acid binding domain-containing protein n=1 Tax=Kitasatospora humi TaxID=2893891 RepID=UPI001E6424FD|nr:OB-fold nucleic acid binding domain-containing protein [Kitasatospora humi]MCC9312070.1 OB-fold nucleic acid binding domain-containing protein [Kitasatospora humi]
MIEQTIAQLRAGGRTAGEARIGGTVTAIDRRTNRARNEWAAVTLTDSTGVIDAMVFPRTWSQVHERLVVGVRVSVTGRLNVATGLAITCWVLLSTIALHGLRLRPSLVIPIRVRVKPKITVKTGADQPKPSNGDTVDRDGDVW